LNKTSTIFSNKLQDYIKVIEEDISILDRKDIGNEEKKEILKTSLENISFNLSILKEYLDLDIKEFEKVDIDKVFDTIKIKLSTFAKEKRVNVYIKKSGVSFYTDRVSFKSAIYNIAFEILKNHSNLGNLNIYALDTFGGVYISISDKAKASTKLKELFEVFEKVDTKAKNFTIELALSNLIIEKLGGEMRVKSNKSIGNDFIIYLPKKPKKSIVKKLALFAFLGGVGAFLWISNFPIYPQSFEKVSNGEYEIYKFEDGSIVKFRKKSNYKLSSHKNLYNTKYTLKTSIKNGQMFLKNRHKAYIEIDSKKFEDEKGEIGVFDNKIAVFDGEVKSENLLIKKGEGVVVGDKLKEFKLLNIEVKSGNFIILKNPEVVKYEIIVSSNSNFTDVVESFYTTQNRIELNLKKDTLYFVKIFGFDKNGTPSMPKVVKYLNLSHYKKALKLLKDSKEEALLELKSSISTIKDYSPLPYFEIAKLYFHKKEYKKSIKYLSKALQLEKNLDYYLLLFDSYNKIGKILDIKDKVNYLFDKHSENMDLLYFKALVLYYKKEYKKASVYLFRLLQLNPHYKGANKLMGEILQKEGNKKLSTYYKNLEK